MVLKHKEGRRIKCIIFCPTAKIEDLVFSAHNFPHCIYQQSHHHHHTSNHKTSLSFFPQPIKRPETSQKIFHVNHPSFWFPCCILQGGSKLQIGTSRKKVWPLFREDILLFFSFQFCPCLSFDSSGVFFLDAEGPLHLLRLVMSLMEPTSKMDSFLFKQT